MGGRPQRSAGVGGTDEMAAICNNEYGNRPPPPPSSELAASRTPLQDNSGSAPLPARAGTTIPYLGWIFSY
ncbi:MAG: hypothetical protein LBB22_00590 [Treponema sp.]|nr:hypothetical protein [Treponema sp.]